MTYRRIKPIDIPTDEEIQMLVDACPDSKLGIRDRALIMFLAKTGVRVGELIRIEQRDIEGDRVHIRFGKGGTHRRIRLFDDGGYINEWLSYRNKHELENFPLFCSLSGRFTGNPMSQPQIHQMLQKVATHAGIEKRIHAHGFRHRLAVTLALEDAPTFAIMHQLGHQNVKTTEAYLSGLGEGPAMDMLDGLTA